MPAIVTITARLARDPESRSSRNGNAMTTLVLPVDSGWGDEKTTTWWRCTLFGRQAEAAQKYLTKGSWVCVSGPCGVREDEGKNGQGFSPELTANEWSFVGDKSQPQAPARRDNGAGLDPVIPF